MYVQISPNCTLYLSKLKIVFVRARQSKPGRSQEPFVVVRTWHRAADTLQDSQTVSSRTPRHSGQEHFSSGRNRAEHCIESYQLLKNESS